MTKPYCTAPWNGITVREDGSVRTCCNGSVSLGNVNEQPIEQIVNNDIHSSIKRDLLSNINHKNCSVCLNQEKQTGVATLRDHYNSAYPELTDQLKFLDIRWNNFCNLSCTYCTPQFSSTWGSRLGSNVKVIKHGYDKELELWILEKSNQIKELMLVGGEPLLMKQNYALINKLSDDVRLSIITNLSYNLDSLPIKEKLFNRPLDNTIWNISVENYGEKFEYIRRGADWELFKNNLKLLVNNNPNNVNILMVFGIFTALTLLDTVKFYYSLGIKKLQVQMLHGNLFMNVFNYPGDIIELVYNEVVSVIEWQKETFGIDYEFYKTDSLTAIAENLRLAISDSNRKIVSQQDFINGIAEYDRWQKEKFSTLWSQEYKLILNNIID